MVAWERENNTGAFEAGYGGRDTPNQPCLRYKVLRKQEFYVRAIEKRNGVNFRFAHRIWTLRCLYHIRVCKKK